MSGSLRGGFDSSFTKWLGATIKSLEEEYAKELTLKPAKTQKK